MPEAEIFDWVILVVACIAVAGLAVWLWRPSAKVVHAPAWLVSGSKPGLTAWLFDGERLVDTTETARDMLPANLDTPRWADLFAVLSERFPDFPASPEKVGAGDAVFVCPAQAGHSGELTVEWLDGMTRVQLAASDTRAGPSQCSDPASPGHELKNLRAAVDLAPNPIWRIDPDGQVTWRNAAYLKLEKNLCRDAANDNAPIFAVQAQDLAHSRTRRLPVIQAEMDRKLWFDVTVVPEQDGAVCYASDVNAVVDGENAQRNFVQTLAKTFAQLSIGLAIFDRNRQLALFNPALIDLTALPAEFLSGRPNLLTFFDRLRDHRMMPEPKNYQSWRQKLAELVQAASDGRYQETWSLPSGSVYSVTGRPHPDGAIAFLIEDITAEITLTRRFRSELEMGQAILDRLDSAIVVFSSQGGLTFSNSAYRELWSVDPDQSFAQVTMLDATRSWQEKCRPTPVWGDIREYVVTRENRADWTATVTLLSGVALHVAVHPMQNGSTMVIFSSSPAHAETENILAPTDQISG